MQEKHLFEYAVIRFMPQVERQEFMNVGVIVYCSGQRFLQTMFEINETRLQAFARQTDVLAVRERLHAFQQVCNGGAAGGPIGLLPLASRFRWLTAARSTIIQTSPVHPGFCGNPAKALLQLHRQFVE